MAPAAGQLRPRRRALAAVLAAVAAALSGCGSSSSEQTTPTTTTTTTISTTTTTRTAGPVDCKESAVLSRGHCSKCWWTGGSDGKYECKECLAPYSLDATSGACTATCQSPAAKPAMPSTAVEHNGVQWPEACFDDTSAHFLTIGDWGGVCSWQNGKNLCDGNSNPMQYDPIWKAQWPDYPFKKDPFPMNNRHEGSQLAFEDYVAQHLVRERMAEKVAKLQEQGEAPKFVINVGDNFYPGGVDSHCGAQPTAAFESTQFEQVFEEMYPVDKLTNIEWWSVLGNHDYGGTCAIKGWDQQIYYTWKDGGRWVMPGQYWSRRAQFKTFSVDFFFLDTNVYDTKAQNPGMEEKHDICSLDNTGRDSKEAPKMGHCPKAAFPPIGGGSEEACPGTGLDSASQCDQWFLDTWTRQRQWFLEKIAQSDADWQIVVTHYPATYNPGPKDTVLVWPQVAKQYGIDLIISGHTHEQRVIYKTVYGGVDMNDTAWVITGGGGGVTAEAGPSKDGQDDTYGFMDMKISLDSIEITSISHGGREGKYVERAKATVLPRARSPATEQAAAELAEVVV